MSNYDMLCARKKNLMEQLEKLEEKEADLREQKRKINADLKKTCEKLEVEDLKREAEKNRKIMETITETFGAVTDENYDTFVRSMRDRFGDKKPDGMDLDAY